MAHLGRNDSEGYRKSCATMLQRFRLAYEQMNQEMTDGVSWNRKLTLELLQKEGIQLLAAQQ